MAENLDNWWRRRQRSKGVDVPYPIGRYRAAWARFPVLIRQYHPDLNSLITLTQIPPAADVYLLWQCDSGHRFVATPAEQRDRPDRTRRRSSWCPECTVLARSPGRGRATTSRPRRSAAGPRVAAAGAPGTAFRSESAPRPASAAEAALRKRIAARLDVDLTVNAVSVRRPFHGRYEVWPDIVIAELMVAIEYDTTGRTATEHVGSREASDRTKDRLLREVGWQVIRIRTSRLERLGPYDVLAGRVTADTIDEVIGRLGEIRGDLFLSAYQRPRNA